LVSELIVDNLTKRSLVKQGMTANEVCDLMLINSELSSENSFRRGIVLVSVGPPLLMSRWLGLDGIPLLDLAFVTGEIGFMA